MDAIVDPHGSIGEAVCFCESQLVLVQCSKNGPSAFSTEIDSQIMMCIGHGLLQMKIFLKL